MLYIISKVVTLVLKRKCNHPRNRENNACREGPTHVPYHHHCTQKRGKLVLLAVFL